MEKIKPDSQRIKKICKALIIIFILFSAVFSSMATAYQSALTFFKVKPSTFLTNSFSKVYGIPGYSTVLDYTGLSTGYGFFSPNVSSDFLVTHHVYNQKQRKLLVSNASFKSKEGSLRYTHVNSVFMEKLEALEDSTKIDSTRLEFLNLILRRMNENQLIVNKADSVTTQLFLYHYPFLNEYPNTNAKIIKIKSYTKEL